MSGEGFPGSAGANAAYSEYNTIQFLIRQFMNTVRTAGLVKVVACTNTDNVAAVGFVDVVPLVNLMDGQNNGAPHATFYNLPYFRLQGGPNAIIMDPQVGDIGLAAFCDRDITTVKKTKKAANPNTPRRFNMSDGIYFGGVLNAVPTQYVRFTQDGNGNATGITVVDVYNNTVTTDTNGISITDKNSNTFVMDTNGITINGVLFDRSKNVSAVKDLTTTGNASLGGGSKKIVLDGDTVSGGVVIASSTKARAT